ncbi:MAG: insulinase family protein, partial [Polyangiaceae bacterium]
MIRRRALWAGAAGAALGAIVGPRVARAGAPSIRRLANGLVVAVEEDHRAPRVGIAVAYDVGQRDDPPGYQGLAHMVEHLLFQGSANVPEDGHFKILERLGATDQGGFTGLDRTIVYEELPAHAWGVGLWLESDRMAYMLRHADERGVAMQREVIRNEWRQRGGDNAVPNRLALATQLMYPLGHPYRVEIPRLA